MSIGRGVPRGRGLHLAARGQHPLQHLQVPDRGRRGRHARAQLAAPLQDEELQDVEVPFLGDRPEDPVAPRDVVVRRLHPLERFQVAVLRGLPDALFLGQSFAPSQQGACSRSHLRVARDALLLQPLQRGDAAALGGLRTHRLRARASVLLAARDAQQLLLSSRSHYSPACSTSCSASRGTRAPRRSRPSERAWWCSSSPSSSSGRASQWRRGGNGDRRRSRRRRPGRTGWSWPWSAGDSSRCTRPAARSGGPA